MIEPVALKLPWPPSVNRRYFAASRGVLVLTKPVKQYRAQCQGEIANQGSPTVGTGDLALSIALVPPEGQVIGDADNRLKELLDVLEHCEVIGNDRQVAEMHVWREKPKNDGWNRSIDFGE